jgi:hypothetical protein
VSSGGGGTNTVTQNSAPPLYVQQAYQSLLANANQDIAAQPTFQPYTGNTVADFSPDQHSAITETQSAQGIADPYINAAAQEIGASTTPLAPSIAGYNDQAMTALAGAQSGIQAGQQLTDTGAQFTVAGGTPITAANINQFESPYTKDVVNATQAEFNNQNQQQQQQVQSGAAMQGAYGGDRAEVAKGITAGQEQLAQAPVIAGLENTGFQTALTAAEQQKALQQQAGQGLTAAGNAFTQSGSALTGEAQGINATGAQVLGANEANAWLDSQAGFGMANLGNEANSTTLSDASALMGVGGTEQQLAQENLNVPYENYIAAQAYPFQTTNWLSGITSGAGSGAGGTSSTSSPGASVGSQLLGTGLATTGILGQTGAFFGPAGQAGWLTGLGGGAAAGTDAALSTGALSSLIDAGGGLGAGAVGGDLALAALAKDGGAIPGRAPGGIVPHNVVPFPQHRVNRGIAPANDDMPPPIPQRAAGGIAIPQLPSNVSVNAVAPNGVAIPQLPAGGGGGIAPSGGMDAVNSYLANNAQYVPPAPKPAPAPAAGIQAPASAPASSQPPEVAGPGETPEGVPTADNPNPWTNKQSQEWFSQWARGGAIRRDDGGDIPDSGVDLPDWAGGRGDHQGIVHHDLPAPQNVVPPDAWMRGQQPPDPDIYSNAQVPQGGISPDPTPSPGGGIAPPMPQARQPIRPVSHQTAGNGIAPQGPPPPPPPMGAVDGDLPMQAPAADPNGPLARATKEGAPQHGGSAPWEMLTAAGLAIMGGKSPHALENIGEGGLKGLQFGEQQRVREENAELRRLQQEDLAQWRQTTAGINQQKIPILQERADTGQSAMNNRATYQQGLLAARQQGLTDKEFNDQWLRGFRQSGQDFNQQNSIDKSARGWASLDQRTTQQQQNAAEAKRNHDMMESDRQARLKQTGDIADKRLMQTQTDAEYANTRSIYSTAINNGQKMSWQKAAEIAHSGRTDAQPQQTQQAAPQAPPQPQTVPPGSAYSPSRGQWRDQNGRLYDASGAPIS